MATNSFPFKLNPFKLELKNRLIVLLFLYLFSKFTTLERVKMNKQKQNISFNIYFEIIFMIILHFNSFNCFLIT